MADPVDILSVATGLQTAAWWRMLAARRGADFADARLDHVFAEIDVNRARKFAEELSDAGE